MYPKSTDYQRLTNQLNALLDALCIPITLESPMELTPSLLIALLEGLLVTRIPLDIIHGSGDANLQKIKIFLGVLETDILEVDVGLSEVDPRRLANGEITEVLFIGELLCWVGRRHGLLMKDDGSDDSLQTARQQEVYSPSMSTATKTFTATTLSLHRHTESNTSIGSFVPTVPTWKPSSPLSPRPRCIHEVPSPSITLSPELDSSFADQKLSDPFSPPPHPNNPTVRYTGYISPVDEELELLTFESSRNSSSSKSADHNYSDQSPRSILAALQESRAHTLALKYERARLLEELAKFDALKTS